MVSATWYAGWHSDDLPPSAVSWSKYTHATYAFAVTTADINYLSLTDSDESTVPTFVQAAHSNGVKALISVGGWTGSRYFSTHLSTPQGRTQFATTVLALTAQYSFDGVDFDWEFPGPPGTPGIGCNANSAADASNFALFLTELRSRPAGAALILTAAATLHPWIDADGAPLKDASAFAKTLDWIAIMNYDVWGQWSPTTGPNAPLADGCATSDRQIGSATSALAAWTAAGVPAGQLVLGVPAYGHGFPVAHADAYANGALAPYAPFDKNTDVVGDKFDGGPGPDECGNYTAKHGGLFDFFGMIDTGFLLQDGTVAPGIDYVFDQCSQTPFAYNSTSSVFVSFDDATSFAAKGSFIHTHSLRGFAMWETAGDYNDILLDSIRSAAGFGKDWRSALKTTL